MPETPQPAASSIPASPANPGNTLSSDVEIKGSLTFKTDMVLDGKVEGEIHSPATLTLGENAVVEGEIHTKSVIVRGKVDGNITVEERCELRGSAQVIGDLKASRLVMEENVTLVGKSEVTPKPQAASAPGGISRPLEFVKQAIARR